MGQLIACAGVGGIVVAADSRAELFDPDGAERFITVERLMPVGSHAVLASAGAWMAQDLCRDFAQFARDAGLTDIDALIDAAIPFFTGRYDDFMRKLCEKLPPDPVINLYLLLAGHSAADQAHPWKIFVIWDRPRPPKIEYTQLTHIFTLPRRLGLEYTLNTLVAQFAPLAQMVDTVKGGLAKLAAADERIGPPFHCLTVTKEGVFSM